ncbi:MAG: branched-chain amino acid aminotransferase [Candidatus Lokiarchaeota archaeon]|nr:branched-chain amino acid aminotransferase [Candidatus Lokiarchaeota archaeon]MBD3338643.1 branched-chain amino acid aminotransferase [Candidatus Lokiarchaeota archaeon]
MEAKQIDLDFYNLGFDFIETNKMFVSDYKNGNWGNGKLLPLGEIKLSPAACVLNYGQGIFEGMKALQSRDRKNVLFRPNENAKRFTKSAKRLLMPPYNEFEFVEAVKKVVKENEEYVPPYESGGALYLRPLMIGSGPILGIAPAKEYKFIVYCSPVGPYFPKGFEGITLEITKKYTRASPGGTGFSKTCSNYAGTMMAAKEAKQKGYAQVIFLDSVKMEYISEVGSANFCAILDDVLVTPIRDGTILEGITLKSVMELAEKKLGMQVEERDISYKELFKDSCSEAFCTGTAAVITPIKSIDFWNNRKTFNAGEPGKITTQLYKLLTGIQRLDIEDEFEWTVILE